MGSRKKSRRKLVIEERLFLWYVKEDPDTEYMVLHIISDDKMFNIQYRIDQDEKRRYVIVLGKEFGGVSGTGGAWRRFRCPAWEHEGAVTPGIVRKIIEWCVSERKSIVEVDYIGIPVPLGGCCEKCGYDFRDNISPSTTVCSKCDHPIDERIAYHSGPMCEGEIFRKNSDSVVGRSKVL